MTVSPEAPPEAIEYSVVEWNGRTAFVIDDHLMPFSMDLDNPNEVSSMALNQRQDYYNGINHVSYQFTLENVSTGKKSSFSILGCPLAAMMYPTFATAYNRIVAETASPKDKKFCSRSTHVYIISRSLVSMSRERIAGNGSGLVYPADMIKLMKSGGGMYFMFSSKFEGLYAMLTALKKENNVSERLMMDGCPHCAAYKSRNRL